MGTYVNGSISWEAQTLSNGVELAAESVSIPYDLSGQLIICRVPVCEARPNGYYFAINTGGAHETIGSGCCAWEETKLAEIRLTGQPSSYTEGYGTNVIEYQHPEFVMDTTNLNVNYDVKIDETEDTIATDEEA